MNYDSDTSYSRECSYFVLNVKLPYFPEIIELLSIKMKRFCMHDVIGSEVGQSNWAMLWMQVSVMGKPVDYRP